MSNTTASDNSPQHEYQMRLRDRRASAESQASTYRKIGALRLAFFILAAFILLRALMGHHNLAWWLIPIAVVSIILLAIHQRIYKSQRRCIRAAEFYERGLARLNGQWADKGQTGIHFQDEQHPFAIDLDIFGRGSLFELICTARTRAGEETLAKWLLAPAEPDEIRARQAAIDELRNRLDLREDLALLGEDLRTGINPVALAKWGSAPPILNSWALRITAAFVALLSAIAIGIWFSGSELGMRPFLFVLLIAGFFALWLRERVMRVVNEVAQPSHDLELLSEVLARFEREDFRAIKLTALRAALETNGQAPSKQIARLHTLTAWLDARLNMAFRPISAPFLWTTQFAFAVEAWRKRSGPLVARWLEAIGEIEALCALAGYA
ncbi:MAG TPA: DNA mismatch repair protein MutS, partial [Blastocatellia bacterium]|nr:DNA mismatch repair protein MutS [Blastocatellia bacterium]